MTGKEKKSENVFNTLSTEVADDTITFALSARQELERLEVTVVRRG